MNKNVHGCAGTVSLYYIVFRGMGEEWNYVCMYILQFHFILIILKTIFK